MSNSRAEIIKLYSNDLNRHGQARILEILLIGLQYDIEHLLTDEQATAVYNGIIDASIDYLDNEQFVYFINRLADIDRAGHYSKKVIDLRDYTGTDPDTGSN